MARKTKKQDTDRLIIAEIDRMIEQTQHEIDRAEQRKSNRIVGWLVVVNVIVFGIIWLGDFQ